MHIFFRGTITMIMLNETQNYLKHQVTKPYTFGLFDLEKEMLCLSILFYCLSNIFHLVPENFHFTFFLKN